MKKTYFIPIILVTFLISLNTIYSQVPQGFTYQAVATNNQGTPIINSALVVKIGILPDETSNNYVWQEQHNVTTSPQGIITLIVGSGTRLGGTASNFTDISWTASPLYIRTEINYQGTWKNMGTTRMWSTPYSIVSGNAAGIAPGAKLSVVSANDASSDALFEVKRKDGQTVFSVYPDAVNVYVPNGVKGSKGGFAIGGFDQTKGYSQDYLRVTPDSIRVYIDNTPGKGSKGGFAVGGFNQAKAGSLVRNYYMNISGASALDTVSGSPQILWYPNKNAFLAGNVHIGNKDSVGLYSTALGYRSIAMGDYSQAFGWKAKAFGDFSTSIGKASVAGARTGTGHGTSTASNAFAFGNGTRATADDSYAFGSGAIASGYRSFAFGSVGLDESGNPTTTPTTANMPYTFAIGMGAQATQKGAMALGIGSLSSGYYSNSFGFYSISSGSYSTALGYRSTASGYYSAALGRSAQANGTSSIALGYGAIAGGSSSVSLGVSSNASGASSMALGVTALSSALNSFAIGTNSKAQAPNAYSFGTNANASLDNAYAIGYGAIASGNTSMGVGYGSTASAQNAVAFGNSNTANGNFSVALGNSNIAGTAANAIALGNSNTSSGANSISLGNNNASSGSQSVAIGTYATSSNTNSTAIGYYAQATGVKAVSVGANYYKSIFIKPILPIIRPIFILPKSGNLADPNQIVESVDGSKGGYVILPTSINRNNIAEGEYSIALGNGNYASNGGVAVGVYNDASAQFATAIGFGNNASKINSFAAGYANKAEGEFSAAFGRYTNATSENSFVIGRYNYSTGDVDTWVDTDPVFQIGNGSSSSEPHDAFRVLKNGGTYIYPTNAYAGLWVSNSNNTSYGSTYAYGIISGMQRNQDAVNYYSGYFYDAGGGKGTYRGLYADVRWGASIDVAELIYDSFGDTEAADVVVADPSVKESVIKSSSPYQTGVLGVISTNPHMTMGMELITDLKTGEEKKGVRAAKLALTGRVPVKVCGENGAIQPGDYLTTSSTPGVAMKWTLMDVKAARDFDDLKNILAENERRRNTIIGKSLESYSGGGTGKIMMLISLQ
jgi:hypothetical protein